MRKIRNIIWIAAFIVLSIPVGGYFALGTQGFTLDDYFLKYTAGACAAIIVFGLITLFIYRFAKRTGNKDPLKQGLLASSLLFVLFSVIVTFWVADVRETRAQLTYLEWLESEFNRSFSKRLNEVGPVNEATRLKLKTAASSICAQFDQKDVELNKMIEAKDTNPIVFISKSPGLKHVYNVTIESMDDEMMTDVLLLK